MSGSEGRGLAAAPLIIPVVGPLLSAILYPMTTQIYGISYTRSEAAAWQQQVLAWSLPWALVDGVAQVAGMAMTIRGAMKLRASRRAPVLAAPWTPPTGGHGLALSGVF